MRVLVLSDLYPPDVVGGYELGCRQVADALIARGHEVRVLTSVPRTPAPSPPHVKRTLSLTDVWSNYLYRKSAPVTVRLTESQSHRIDAHNVHALIQELEEFRPDVVYLWMLVGIGGLGLLGCLHHLRVPWVWHLMDDVPLILCKSGGEVVPAFAREFNRQIRGTYLACSQQLVDEIASGGIELNGEVEVLPNWVRGPDLPTRQDYLQGGHLRIASAASLIEKQSDKGLDVLVESAARLRELGHEDFSIDLYGTVTDGYIPHLIHQFKLEDRVTLKGKRPQGELARLYPEYDIFAFPTRPREPFGFAALEAAARGCVPVLTNVCGFAEWMVHGVHCLKAPRTPEAFARAFAAILDGRTDLAPIGRRAAAVVRRDFHLDGLVGRIENALASASRRPRDGAGSAADAYRMAVLAERLARVLIQEAADAA